METARIIEKYFYQDGSLRDIYLLKAEQRDWDAILNLFVKKGIEYHIIRDGDVITEDITVSQIYKQHSEFSFYMSINLSTISLSGYFNHAEFIEFDVTPKIVQTEKALNELISFMQEIAGVTNKEARLTPEMEFETPYIVILPNGTVTYN